MKRFIKTIVPTEGYEEVKKIGNKWLVHLEPQVDGEATTCYEIMVNEQPVIATLTADLQEWKTYMAGRELEIKKMVKLQELTAYDKSKAVDNFIINRGGVKLIDYWIGRNLRSSLKDDVQAATKMGETYDFDVRELGITLTLNCEKFLAALDTLRVYAYTTFNTTSRHMAAINALQTVEAVDAYDFTQNYPPQLTFNLEDLT